MISGNETVNTVAIQAAIDACAANGAENCKFIIKGMMNVPQSPYPFECVRNLQLHNTVLDVVDEPVELELLEEIVQK